MKLFLKEQRQEEMEDREESEAAKLEVKISESKKKGKKPTNCG